MTEFCVKLAGVPLAIRCRHLKNCDFFKDYFTDEPPQLTVAPGEEDIALAEEQLRQQALQDGTSPGAFSPAFVENSAIHWLLANALIPFGVLLMHGSAIVLDGECYIFTAPSGTGKSTHTRLWRQQFGDRAYMLNDDKPMLTVGERGVTAYGTPWDGKHHLSRNAAAPLRAIISLQRDTVNHIEPLPAAEAIPVLYTQALRPYDTVGMQKVLKLENQIINTVPFYRLGCNMNPEAALVAYAGIRKEETV